MSKRDSSVFIETEQETKKALRKARRRRPVNTVRRTIFLILALIVGMALICAPVITNYLEYAQYNDAVIGYEESSTFFNPNQKEDILNQAYDYNESLSINRFPTIEQYDSALSFDDAGIMGLLRIPKTETVLPIYHSTVQTENVHGIVQLGPSGTSRGSSLPVGGPSTHAYLSNVNALPSSKLFNNISELDSGDTINILVCSDELVYEITSAKTMTTQEASNISIPQGEDLVTMILAPQDDDTSRFVVTAQRSPISTSLYLGSYDTSSFQDKIKVIILNMSVPQGIMFIVGCIVVFFFLARWLVQLSDRAPREIGRLTGDTG